MRSKPSRFRLAALAQEAQTRWLAGIVSLLLMAALGTPGTALAATSFTVSPARAAVSVLSGSTATTVLRVTNDGDVSLQLTAVPADFAVDASGATSFAAPSAAADSCALWTSVTPGAVTLAPGRSGKLEVTVSVPSTAAVGAYRAAVLVGPPAVSSGIGTKYAGKIGIKVVAEVTSSDPTGRPATPTRPHDAPWSLPGQLYGRARDAFAIAALLTFIALAVVAVWAVRARR